MDRHRQQGDLISLLFSQNKGCKLKMKVIFLQETATQRTGYFILCKEFSKVYTKRVILRVRTCGPSDSSQLLRLKIRTLSCNERVALMF
jgi:hypothetical protein